MKSVSVHCDFFKQIRKHSEEEIGRFFLALAAEIDGGEMPELPATLEMLKEMVIDQNQRFSKQQAQKREPKNPNEPNEPNRPNEICEPKQPSVSVSVTKDTKDYPTGEPGKPSASPAPPDGELTETEGALLPVSEAPDAMRQTAEYLLLKTGRTGLTDEEISALRTLNASQYPARVQKEIDIAVDRFKRLSRSPESLTFCYIADSLARQPSRQSARASPRQRPPLDYSELNV